MEAQCVTADGKGSLPCHCAPPFPPSGSSLAPWPRSSAAGRLRRAAALTDGREWRASWHLRVRTTMEACPSIRPLGLLTQKTEYSPHIAKRVQPGWALADSFVQEANRAPSTCQVRCQVPEPRMRRCQGWILNPLRLSHSPHFTLEDKVRIAGKAAEREPRGSLQCQRRELESTTPTRLASYGALWVGIISRFGLSHHLSITTPFLSHSLPH